MVPTSRPLAALAGLALLCLPLTAQQPPVETFMETIDVRVINIETVVTDGSGQRVSGLQAEDFRLLVDGREVPIDFFSEIRDGRAIEATGGEAAPAVLPTTEAPEPDAIATNYLVFVDDVFTVGAQRNLVLKKLRNGLSILGPQDRMRVMAFDGRNLVELSDWTRSETDLQEAFKMAAKRQAGGPFRAQEQRAFGATGLTGGREAYAAVLEANLRAVTGAAVTSMRVAGNPEGRKVLLLLAGGWPYEIVSPISPGRANEIYEAVAAAGDDWILDWDPDVRMAWERMATLNDFWRYPRGPALYAMVADTANRLGYTIYPVDVPGLGGSGRTMERDDVNMLATTNIAANPNEPRNEATLLLLAHQTGGKAILNDLRLKALDRAVEDTRTYYWLGFRSDNEGNDRRHKVRVEPRQDGLRARARRDYVDFSKGVEANMANEAALLLGRTTGGDLTLTAGEPERLPEKQMEVPLQLSIPVDQIAVMPVDDGYAAMLEVRVRAMDNKKIPSDVGTVTANLRSDKAPPPGSRALYEFSVTLRRQPHDLAVTVRDMFTGELYTTHTKIEP